MMLTNVDGSLGHDIYGRTIYDQVACAAGTVGNGAPITDNPLYALWPIVNDGIPIASGHSIGSGGGNGLQMVETSDSVNSWQIIFPHIGIYGSEITNRHPVSFTLKNGTNVATTPNDGQPWDFFIDESHAWAGGTNLAKFIIPNAFALATNVQASQAVLPTTTAQSYAIGFSNGIAVGGFGMQTTAGGVSQLVFGQVEPSAGGEFAMNIMGAHSDQIAFNAVTIGGSNSEVTNTSFNTDNNAVLYVLGSFGLKVNIQTTSYSMTADDSIVVYDAKPPWPPRCRMPRLTARGGSIPSPRGRTQPGRWPRHRPRPFPARPPSHSRRNTSPSPFTVMDRTGRSSRKI